MNASTTLTPLIDRPSGKVMHMVGSKVVERLHGLRHRTVDVALKVARHADAKIEVVTTENHHRDRVLLEAQRARELAVGGAPHQAHIFEPLVKPLKHELPVRVDAAMNDARARRLSVELGVPVTQ